MNNQHQFAIFDPVQNIYWSNRYGWVSEACADKYTWEQTKHFSLSTVGVPMAMWVPVQLARKAAQMDYLVQVLLKANAEGRIDSAVFAEGISDAFDGALQDYLKGLSDEAVDDLAHSVGACIIRGDDGEFTTKYPDAQTRAKVEILPGATDGQILRCNLSSRIGSPNVEAPNKCWEWLALNAFSARMMIFSSKVRTEYVLKPGDLSSKEYECMPEELRADMNTACNGTYVYVIFS